ncbi:atp4 subunit B of the stator stalk of mitochondrial F1F0 ATP synthase [Tulasnella sp. 427]|nr:atp4 subunit B of the stator stalk of mitochondrial F1F0 ATP synthase [Tulasnella sp. 427]
MAARIATSSLRSSLLRSSAVASIPRVAAIQSRGLADKTPSQPPAERASAIIDAVPGNSLVSKTGAIVLGTGLTAAAISSEIYVVNEETVVLAGFLIIATFIARSMRGPYKEWAEGHINKIRDVLNAARAEHTQAVSSRIDAVGQMKDVVDVTKGLFALSKETAQLEADSFILKQQNAVNSEVKAVLDSWVRYEQQAKEDEQAQLTKAIIDKVMKGLTDEKNQKDILLAAVAEVEQLVKSKAI